MRGFSTTISSHKNWTALLLAFSLASDAFAQAAPFSYLDRLKNAEARAGAPAIFEKLETMPPEQHADFLDDTRGLIDLLRTMRSLSGDAAGTTQASVWFDIASDTPQKYAAHAPLPEQATMENAVQAIVREAGQRQIVILNEAHHMPVHRVFAGKLAGELRKIGFSYLAAEAFVLTIPLHPTAVTQDMGFYVREPMYAGFVRSAMRDGWSFIGYDTNPEAATQAERNRLREIGAARNIVEKIFANDPKAKVFIYVGYGHAAKSGVRPDGWKSLATLLKETLGIDPLTIDQTTMYARGDARVDHPAYRVAMKRFAPLQPGVLKAMDRYVVLGAAGSFDMQVYHPDDVGLSQEGRPLWMSSQAGLKPHPVPQGLLPASGRRLIKAIHSGEGAAAVPADIVMVEGGKPAPALMLPRGDFIYDYEE